jgi:hypothetical protein
MRARTTRILATTLAATVAMTATAWTPTGAQQRVRSKPDRPVIAEYPGKGNAKKHRKARVRHRQNKRHAYQARPDYSQVRFTVVRAPRRVIVRPVLADAFVIRGPRYVVVRPIPVWVHRPYRPTAAARISARLGRVIFAVTMADRSPHHGCNFCDAHFASYWAWEAHVTGCARWRGPTRVIAVPWDEGDLDYFRERAHLSYWRGEDRWVRYRG